MFCLTQPKVQGGLGRARMLLGSCMSFPINDHFLAATVQFQVSCRHFAPHLLEPLKSPGWGKVTITHLFSNTEVLRLYIYQCCQVSERAVSQAQQESCVPVYTGVTWFDWAVVLFYKVLFLVRVQQGNQSLAGAGCLACGGYLEVLVCPEWNYDFIPSVLLN